MKVDCRWIEENLESFFCDRLTPEEDRLAHAHVEQCGHCREQVEALTSVDPLVKQVFRYDLGVARAPRRRRSPVLVGAVAAALAALLLVVAWNIPRPAPAPPMLTEAPAPVPPSTQSEAAAIPKVSDATQTERAKPQPVAPDKAAAVPANPATAPDKAMPDFEVTDAAGYSKTLSDYRGYLLIVGVWNGSQPRSVANLERVYQSFGPNTKLRILGITNDRQPKPSIATFPIVYNHGSLLLGAKESELVIVDGWGKVLLKESLLQETAPLMTSIRKTLHDLGIN